MALIPEPVAQQPHQEQGPVRTEGVVQAEEPTRPTSRGRRIGLQPPVEDGLAVRFDRRHQQADEAVVDQHLEGRTSATLLEAIGQVVGLEGALLGDMDAIGGIDPGRGQEAVETAGELGRVQHALAGDVEHQLGLARRQSPPDIVGKAEIAGVFRQGVGAGEHHEVRRRLPGLVRRQELEAIVAQVAEHRSAGGPGQGDQGLGGLQSRNRRGPGPAAHRIPAKVGRLARRPRLRRRQHVGEAAGQ